MLVFPMAWLFFEFGFPPQMAYISVIVVFLLHLVIRLFLMKEMIGMSIIGYIKTVLLRVISTTIVAAFVPILVMFYEEEGIDRLFIILIVSTIMTSLSIIYIGLDTKERNKLCDFIIKKIKTR